MPLGTDLLCEMSLIYERCSKKSVVSIRSRGCVGWHALPTAVTAAMHSPKEGGKSQPGPGKNEAKRSQRKGMGVNG